MVGCAGVFRGTVEHKTLQEKRKLILVSRPRARIIIVLGNRPRRMSRLQHNLVGA